MIVKKILMTYSEEQNRNRDLVERYPFLVPRNWRTGEIVSDYDYSYTMLDDMPIGWRKAFGLLIVDDIAAVLKKADYLDKYRVIQIKEKFGGLRWYDDGVPREICDEMDEIIDKYEHLSLWTCIDCGRFPAQFMSTGWISPYCEQCASKFPRSTFRPIEEYIECKFSPVFTRSLYRDGDYSYYEADCSDIIARMMPIQKELFEEE